MNRLLITIAVLISALPAGAQEGVTTFGMQLRPLIPNEIVNFREVEASGEGIDATWIPRPSLIFGGMVRYGFTDSFSIESGINMVRRNYRVRIEGNDLGVQGELRNAFVGYEIPFQGLYYVRLSDKLWMNASGGLSLDMYPSNTFSAGFDQRDTIFYDLEQFTQRRRWLQIAVTANYGFEWRTKEKGYFYLGASYHQPIGPMAYSEAVIRWQGGIRRVITPLDGTYFTIDLRYFFHEDPERR